MIMQCAVGRSSRPGPGGFGRNAVKSPRWRSSRSCRQSCLMSSKLARSSARKLTKLHLSQVERATKYVEEAPRIQLDDLRDNPGARSQGRMVNSTMHNQAGHTVGELQRAAKPPLGWTWGDFFKPWQRIFPGDKEFNGDVKREYVPLSLVELQRLIDLNWLDPSRKIDITQICNTSRVVVNPEWRQFGIMLTDEGAETIQQPLDIEVQWATQTVFAAIEKAGGRVRCAYYDLDSLRAVTDPKSFFLQGKPVPRRKLPPHSLLSFYRNPKNRGYLANNEDIQKEEQRLAEILKYERVERVKCDPSSEKTADQVFAGLEPGSLVSLVDKKVLIPTHAVHRDYYRGTEQQLADHMH